MLLFINTEGSYKKKKGFFFAVQFIIVGDLSFIYSAHLKKKNNTHNILVLESSESCVTEVCNSQDFSPFSFRVNWNANFVVWNLLTS